MNLNQLFDKAKEAKASDIHFATGEIPRMRVGRDLVPLGDTAPDSAELWDLLSPAFSADTKAQIQAGQKVERSVMSGELAFLATAFSLGEGGVVTTFRLLQNTVPRVDEIAGSALELFEEILGLRRGLVVISGPTGSGKATTACALVEHLNERKPIRIFVVNTQPGYVFRSKTALVTQLLVGQDCESLVEAMRLSHRSDLDVICLDHLPDEETVEQALVLADTGHLVIANMHAEDSREALRLLMQLGASHPEAYRRMLAANLRVVTGQRLFSNREMTGRVPAYDWIKVDDPVQQAMLKGSFHDVESLPRDPKLRRSPSEAFDLLVQDGMVAVGL